jgi:hypothetical protein
VTNQLLEYSKDKFYLYESASGLPLYILTGEQEFYLESVQLVSQDKILFYRDFSPQTHSLNNWWFCELFRSFHNIYRNSSKSDSHSLMHGQIWIFLKSFFK